MQDRLPSYRRLGPPLTPLQSGPCPGSLAVTAAHQENAQVLSAHPPQTASPLMLSGRCAGADFSLLRPALLPRACWRRHLERRRVLPIDHRPCRSSLQTRAGLNCTPPAACHLEVRLCIRAKMPFISVSIRNGDKQCNLCKWALCFATDVDTMYCTGWDKECRAYDPTCART